jgi:hypothetical protein
MAWHLPLPPGRISGLCPPPPSCHRTPQRQAREDGEPLANCGIDPVVGPLAEHPPSDPPGTTPLSPEAALKHRKAARSERLAALGACQGALAWRAVSWHKLAAG